MARRGEDIWLSAADSVEDAFRRVVANCRDQLAENLRLIPDTDDTEPVHQARVALRRLDAAVSAFRDAIAWRKDDPVRAELRWLKNRLGAARDADVLALDTLPCLEAATPDATCAKAIADAVERLRLRRRLQLVRALNSARGQGVVSALDEWVESRRWRPGGDPYRTGRQHEPVTDLAALVLDRLNKKTWAAGADMRELSAKERHKTRLRLKRLRYASDIFRSLYDPERTAEYLKRLKTAQDRLGAANDLENARSLIAEATAGCPNGLEGTSKRLVDEWRKRHVKPTLKQSTKSCRKLREVEPFWRTGLRTAAE